MIGERTNLYRHILAVFKSRIGALSKVQWEAVHSLSLRLEERDDLGEVIERGRVCSLRDKNAS